MDIQIKKIRLSELQEFVNSDEFSEIQNSPISRNRVKSYLFNPNSDSKEFILYMGFYNKNLVVYRTLLQDKIKNEIDVVVWLSGVWVHPDFRRKGLASRLLDEVYKDYKGRIFSTNLGINSLKLLKTNPQFELINSLEGHRFYYRLSLSEILPPKSDLYLKLKPLFKLTDRIGNIILDQRFLFQKKKINLNITEAEFNEELRDFISKHNQNSLFKRNIEEFKWTLNYPWVKQQVEEREDKNYHFTTSAGRFQQNAKIYKLEDKITGFLFYTVKNEVLKIHYLFVDSDLELDEFASFILDLIRQTKISYVILTEENLIRKLKRRKGFLFSKIWKKGFFVGKKLLEDHPEISKQEIYMGDGDSIFT